MSNQELHKPKVWKEELSLVAIEDKNQGPLNDGFGNNLCTVKKKVHMKYIIKFTLKYQEVIII